MADERPPRRGLWLGAGAALIALAATAVGLATTDEDQPGPAVAPSATPSVSTPAGSRSARALIALPRAAGTWPGTNGMSGVNGDPVFDTAHVDAFCAARGRPCRIAQTYTDRSSWTAMTAGSGWTFDLFSDFDGMLVVSQGLVPIGSGESSLAAGVTLGVLAHLLAVPAAVALGALASRAVTRTVRNGLTVLLTGAVLTIVLGLSGSVAPWLAPPVMATARALAADDLPSAGRFWLLAGWTALWCAVVFGGYARARRSRS